MGGLFLLLSKDSDSQQKKTTNEGRKKKGKKRSTPSKGTRGESKEPHAGKVVREKKKAKPQGE
jgi:hypothetical protein